MSTNTTARRTDSLRMNGGHCLSPSAKDGFQLASGLISLFANILIFSAWLTCLALFINPGAFQRIHPKPAYLYTRQTNVSWINRADTLTWSFVATTATRLWCGGSTVALVLFGRSVGLIRARLRLISPRDPQESSISLGSTLDTSTTRQCEINFMINATLYLMIPGRVHRSFAVVNKSERWWCKVFVWIFPKE